MRLVKDIPHERYKIQIHQYNGKYILQIDLDQFSQSYKIGDTDISGLEELERMITPELLSNALKRFVEMRTDWGKAFNEKHIV